MQPTKWEKNISFSSTSKGLISKLNKEFVKLNPQKQSDFKMAEDLNRHFLQRRRKDDQQTHEKMPNITNHQGKTNQSHNERVITLYLSEWLVSKRQKQGHLAPQSVVHVTLYLGVMSQIPTLGAEIIYLHTCKHRQTDRKQQVLVRM